MTLSFSLFSLLMHCQWPGRPGFNSRSGHTKDTKKWYLMLSLHNTQYYEVWIKSKVEQSRKRS